MNLDLTSSPSRTQKNTTQKKLYKPRKSNTNNTRKSNISIHFPPPKASHNLSSKKKAVTNLFLNQKSFELLLHHYKSERSPIQPYWRGSPANFHVLVNSTLSQLCSLRALRQPFHFHFHSRRKFLTVSPEFLFSTEKVSNFARRIVAWR